MSEKEAPGASTAEEARTRTCVYWAGHLTFVVKATYVVVGSEQPNQLRPFLPLQLVASVGAQTPRDSVESSADKFDRKRIMKERGKERGRERGEKARHFCASSPLTSPRPRTHPDLYCIP